MDSHVVDDVVLLKHAVGVRTDDVAARLRAASTDPVRALFAAPLSATPMRAPDGRLFSLEPRTELAQDANPIPWREIGGLVARLQAIPRAEVVPLPEHGGRAAVEAALARADTFHPGGSTDILRELGRTLLRTWPPIGRKTLVHGRLMLSTIGRLPGTPAWLFRDARTLGVGDASWDLGRPAGLWAAGLLDDPSWSAFTAGYAEAGGAVPVINDPFDSLDHPARCAVFMAAVREVSRCGEYPHINLTKNAEILLAACVRMNGRRW
ncbi:MAG: hypothetical protein QM708_07765 [Propioniciclava sp.]|uniref:hypothetical protein n=1 Tax=Propioniciclava sp. TaxID=2038686 RepID=UPI0039E55B6B